MIPLCKVKYKDLIIPVGYLPSNLSHYQPGPFFERCVCISRGEFPVLLEIKPIHLACNFTVKSLHGNFSIMSLIAIFFISISSSPILWPWRGKNLTLEGSVITGNASLQRNLCQTGEILFLLTFEKLFQDGLKKQEQISTILYSMPVKRRNIFPYHLLEGLQVLVIRHKKFSLVLCNPSGMYWQFRDRCPTQTNRNTKN